MQEDGFQVVTDIYGQYRMDYDANKKCKYLIIFSCVGFATNKKEKEKIGKAKKTTRRTSKREARRGSIKEMINILVTIH